MSDTTWERTAEAVRSAFADGDLTALGPLLAPDVRWHGAGPGGCHSAADVLATIANVPGARLVALRRAGPRVVLQVETGGRVLHQVLTLDGDGRITHLLDYADPAVAEGDLDPAPRRPAAAHVGRLVPFVDVRDVAASVAFYRLLGFEVAGEHHDDGRLVWASLHSDGAELMVAEAEAVDAARQGVLLYLYADDLAGLREHLRAHGAVPSEIADGSPGPAEEMRVDDPDGYCLMIARWER